ncbi:Uncharacterised protein [uncultured archaeon]|nr:Uncharacterised protein [uncultured archaeon]
MLGLGTQDAGTGGMKSAQGQPLHSASQKMVDPFFHLAGCLIGEGDRQDAIGTDAADSYQVSHAVSDDPGLARTRACHNKHRALDSLDGFLLSWIEVS